MKNVKYLLFLTKRPKKPTNGIFLPNKNDAFLPLTATDSLSRSIF
ncbi:hypothetical protein C4K40_3245 [Pseudomonas sp. CMR5c]|nr:hypothetical protein C4K40_3245 [Pseudomonas sp. CMR5c]